MIPQDEDYKSLSRVLEAAYEQAAHGKGKERHARGNPFEEQHMQTISRLLGSDRGMAFQAIKKLTEGMDMPDPEAKERELLGAIVYIAGAIVYNHTQIPEAAQQIERIKRGAGGKYTDILSDGGMDPRDRPEESKPIDWSQVADCVPVRVWDVGADYGTVTLYLDGTRGFNSPSAWDHRSLITGIDIAWSGGECPLPGCVMVAATRRDGNKYSHKDASSFVWGHSGKHKSFEIISFRITGIADGWTEEVK